MTQPEANAPRRTRRAVQAFSAVVLCGGRSRRFGAEKAFAELNGRTLIARQLAVLDSISAEVFISTNQPERFECLGRPMVTDRHTDLGPLGGIEASLRHARHDTLAVVACDMPFTSASLLQYLAGLVTDRFDIVAPVRERPQHGLTPEPLHAIYARSALPAIARAIDLNHLKPARLIEEVRSRLVPPEEWIPHAGRGIPWHANVNTVADLVRFERQAARDLAGDGSTPDLAPRRQLKHPRGLDELEDLGPRSRPEPDA